MKKVLIILIVLIIATALVVWFKVYEEPANVISDDPYTLPDAEPIENSGTGANTLVVPGSTGGIVAVHDVRLDSETQNIGSGNFLFAESGDARSPIYQLLYFERDQSFLISLTKKPLDFARASAENELLTRLNINQAQACELKISVGVPFNVDPRYAGSNLGLSFCPGSTRLDY